MNEPPTEFESASVLQRFVAQGIDTSLVLIFGALPLQLAVPHGSIAIIFALVLFVLALAYRLLADGLFNGAALGKRFLGIHVVDAATRCPCSVGQCFGRMSVLIVPFVYLIEPIILACDGRERWGDRLAHTYVLRRHPKPAPVSTTPSRPFNFDRLGETLAKLKTPDDND